MFDVIAFRDNIVRFIQVKYGAKISKEELWDIQMLKMDNPVVSKEVWYFGHGKKVEIQEVENGAH